MVTAIVNTLYIIFWSIYDGPLLIDSSLSFMILSVMLLFLGVIHILCYALGVGVSGGVLENILRI